MGSHVEDDLYALLSGELPTRARQQAERHLSACAPCRAKLKRAHESLGALPLTLPARPATARGRERLFASIEHIERFAPFASDVSAMLDTDVRAARRALHALSDVDAWPTGPLRGMRFFRLEHVLGPARANAMAAYSCFEPGFVFPRHRHDGDEDMLILEGATTDDTGRRFVAGHKVRSAQGSSHEIRVPVDEPSRCLCLIVNYGGIELA